MRAHAGHLNTARTKTTIGNLQDRSHYPTVSPRQPRGIRQMYSQNSIFANLRTRNSWRGAKVAHGAFQMLAASPLRNPLLFSSRPPGRRTTTAAETRARHLTTCSGFRSLGQFSGRAARRVSWRTCATPVCHVSLGENRSSRPVA